MTPSSSSPDGARLGATRHRGDRPAEAVLLSLQGGGTAVLARGAYEPVYSPDGSQIAFLRGHLRTVRRKGETTSAPLTNVFTMHADGTEAHRVTDTPSAMELGPSWDPSGRRLAFSRIDNPFSEAGLLGLGDAIVEVNADGSCPTRVISDPHVVYFGAAWRPGPGRSVEPFAC